MVLRLDAESYPTLEMLVNGIVAGAAKQFKSGIERAGEQILLALASGTGL